MTTVQIEAGTLTANLADRTVAGVLVPYGEQGRTNLGKFEVPRGAFEIPADPDVVTLNDVHQRETPLGRAVSLSDSDGALFASFRVAKTASGDAYLADVAAGRRRSLSAEVADVVIRAGKAVGGRLFAAAACEKGAFPSATLLAADVGELKDEETTEDAPPSDDAVETAEEESPVDENETATPPAEDEDKPQELRATRPGSAGGKRTTAGKSKTLFATLGKQPMHQAATLLAALDQLLPADVLPAQQQQWLGEIYGSRTYNRRFAPLVQHGNLTGTKALGWKFTTGKTPVVATYAGYPNQPNSNEVASEAVELTAARIAGAGAVDRAFLDFPTPEFWAGYFREQTNSYERVLDGIVRDALIAAGTDVEADTVPTGVATAAAYIVDGALAIIDEERDVPSWALVGSDLYRGLLLTRADDVVAFLTAALGLEEGDLAGFKIRPSSVATLTGKVLVGTKTSATVYELPGSPVRVDTVAIASGGVERGCFGYHAELINDDLGLALVAPAA